MLEGQKAVGPRQGCEKERKESCSVTSADGANGGDEPITATTTGADNCTASSSRGPKLRTRPHKTPKHLDTQQDPAGGSYGTKRETWSSSYRGRRRRKHRQEYWCRKKRASVSLMQLIPGQVPTPPGLGTAGKGDDPAGGLLLLPANAGISIEKFPQQRIDRSSLLKRS